MGWENEHANQAKKPNTSALTSTKHNAEQGTVLRMLGDNLRSGSTGDDWQQATTVVLPVGTNGERASLATASANLLSMSGGLDRPTVAGDTLAGIDCLGRSASAQRQCLVDSIATNVHHVLCATVICSFVVILLPVSLRFYLFS